MMYKYNNQDRSILTGLLEARKYFGEKHNLWDIMLPKNSDSH